MVGDRQEPDPGRRGRGDERGGLEDPIRAQGVGVQVDRRRPRRDDRIRRRVVAASRHAAQTSMSRWIRSIARARPVAGSMSIWVAFRMTGPSPTSNRVGSALRNRGRTVLGVEADDAVDRTGHARGRSDRPSRRAGSARHR